MYQQIITLSIEKQKKWEIKKSRSSHKENEESFGVISTKKSKRCTNVSEASKLLLEICQRFYQNSKIFVYKDDEKEQKVELNLDKKLRLKIDTSNYATEEVLLIKCENRKQRPVAFISKSLNKVKRNNEIHDEEMLAVIGYLEVQKYFFKKAKYQFKIFVFLFLSYKIVLVFMISRYIILLWSIL